MTLTQMPQTCCLVGNSHLDMSLAPNAPVTSPGPERGIHGRGPGFKAARPRPLST